MAEKDISEKVLASFNDVFADIINVLLFDGENKISESELTDTSVHSMYRHVNDGKLHEQEADVLKHWDKFGVRLALFGLENQTKVDELMPLRVMGYEGASYRSQLNEEKAYPVISVVLYFGNEHWNAKKHLKELLNIPNGLEKYVNDCKVNVFEIAWLPDETVAKFKSDFRYVARFFTQKRIDPNYVPTDTKEIRHVDAVLKLLSVLTQDSRYEAVLLNSKEGEIKTMCDVAERLEQIGIEKGRAEGRAEGRVEGRAEGQKIVYVGLIKDGILTLAEAASRSHISIEDLRKALEEDSKA